jgi:peptidyl-tRNA hydrolase, PTH1 family
MDEYLIVGLGNPGSKYENTRHNLGFMVVEALAQKQGLSLKKGWRIDGKIGSGIIGEKKVYLLEPSTYMNLSGTAVRKAVQYYKIALNRVLIVVDDVYVKFGSMRLRPSGGSGGHNGLKSIEACLHTQEYARLRMGVGPQEGNLTSTPEKALEDYVLANFTFSEQVQLSQFVVNGVSVVEMWLNQGAEAASQLAGELSNAKPAP